MDTRTQGGEEALWRWRQTLGVEKGIRLGTCRIPEATGIEKKQGRILPWSPPRGRGPVILVLNFSSP